MSDYNKNNTKALQKEIVDKLAVSDIWLVLRHDKEGTHLHTPDAGHMALFAMWFEGHPEIFEMVCNTVKASVRKNMN